MLERMVGDIMGIVMSSDEYTKLLRDTQDWTRETVADAAAHGDGMDHATLAGLDLSDLRLANAELSHADLTKANLRDADLRGAELNHANLEGADMLAAKLDYVKAHHARLAGANLTMTIARGAQFIKATFTGATLKDVGFKGCIFTGADLTDAILADSSFEECEFDGARMRRINLLGVKFPGCYWKGVDLLGCTIDWTEEPVVWALVREMRDDIFISRFAHAVAFGVGKNKPWWRWVQADVIHDLERWRRDGDNWPEDIRPGRPLNPKADFEFPWYRK